MPRPSGVGGRAQAAAVAAPVTVVASTTPRQVDHSRGITTDGPCTAPAAVPVPFDKDRWQRWRLAQAAYVEVRTPEGAAAEARDAWLRQLDTSQVSWPVPSPLPPGRPAEAAGDAAGPPPAAARTAAGAERSRPEQRPGNALYLRACMYAQLCRFAVDGVLPCPSWFLETQGLLPEQKSHETALGRLFLLVALCTWISRLITEAEALVLGAKDATYTLHFARDTATAAGLRGDEKLHISGDDCVGCRVHGQLKPTPMGPLLLHPLAFVRYLPGGEEAARALVAAERRAARLEVEAEIATHCRTQLLLGVPHRLAVSLGSPELTEALQVLRLIAHVCGEGGAMVSFWPMPHGAEAAPAGAAEPPGPPAPAAAAWGPPPTPLPAPRSA